ncbi:hypothetical protein GUITHDRAFT_112685 [Guillardia theta CCMP2712]|uniref:Uncharacterized protein n=1 Tax=Guillardia theta (strain CCMP2712) TaxID=905079 RepID=L1IY61_GUITC|nr:hypothetical protein GUITHDRAFT_112685 [Guillardia theta CCMP2712]EKX41213.1 hypothetical protein GUITHDRAFT_112685 [Guillardia theta CCMP2712]|eukprot:XP_005828193.1 hypothetical protein GUITHDRAFT_112685 [Guillardia theta CCMP2712]
MESETEDKEMESETENKEMESETEDKEMESETEDKEMESETEDKEMESETEDKEMERSKRVVAGPGVLCKVKEWLEDGQRKHPRAARLTKKVLDSLKGPNGEKRKDSENQTQSCQQLSPKLN